MDRPRPATQPRTARATLPPRWFIRGAWAAHRSLLRATGDRVGLATPTPGGRVGMMRLRAVGRRSGVERAVVLSYLEDGDRLVTLAMNGWHPEDPAWWLNLQAHPEATVDLVGGSRRVIAREAVGEERTRLWTALHDYTGYGDLDAFTARRGREPAVVVLSCADRHRTDERDDRDADAPAPAPAPDDSRGHRMSHPWAGTGREEMPRRS